MMWNKEKAVFAGSVIVAVLTCGMAFQALVRHNPVERIEVRLNQKSSSLPTDVAIPWQEIGVIADPRNPFELISEWRSAPRDPLPVPVLGTLQNRVPVPAILADASGALPLREARREKKKK